MLILLQQSTLPFFGQRSEFTSTYAHRTTHAAGAKETLHVSAFKEGRLPPVALK